MIQVVFGTDYKIYLKLLIIQADQMIQVVFGADYNLFLNLLMM
jgi:hypothetical protein